jgi:hypothetical protein
LEIRGKAPKIKFNTWMGEIKRPIFSFSWLKIPTPFCFSCFS